eukprot:scaffold29071_cov39-Prasinocladus_malaysianus.AAC.2
MPVGKTGAPNSHRSGASKTSGNGCTDQISPSYRELSVDEAIKRVAIEVLAPGPTPPQNPSRKILSTIIPSFKRVHGIAYTPFPLVLQWPAASFVWPNSLTSLNAMQIPCWYI